MFQCSFSFHIIRFFIHSFLIPCFFLLFLFEGSSVPEGYQLHTVHGFVEELVYADDPEYQWFDKIRTPRSTNEARQTLFFKLNGEVKRKIGLKVISFI